MITLFIDTTKTVETIVALEIEGVRVEKQENSAEKRSQSVLPMIEQLLNEQGKTLKDISNIHVAKGPGSFTGLRVGTTIALMLSHLLHIPINNNPPGTLPILEYGENHYGL